MSTTTNLGLTLLTHGVNNWDGTESDNLTKVDTAVGDLRTALNGVVKVAPNASQTVTQPSGTTLTVNGSLTNTATPTYPVQSVLDGASGGSSIDVRINGHFVYAFLMGDSKIGIFDISSGTLVPLAPFTTACTSPLAPLFFKINGQTVLAFMGNDNNTLYTCSVNDTTGALTALGNLVYAPPSGQTYYANSASDGMNFYTPAMQEGVASAGHVYKFSLANPSSPAFVASLTEVNNPQDGGNQSAGACVYSAGYLLVMCGGEPGLGTIQAYDVSSMTLVGTLVVPHSPQQAEIQGNTLYVAFYDAAEVMAIDVTDPKNMTVISTLNAGGALLPIVASGQRLFCGNDSTGNIQVYDITDPAKMYLVTTIGGGAMPYLQNMAANGRYVVAVSYAGTPNLFLVDTGGTYADYLGAQHTAIRHAAIEHLAVDRASVGDLHTTRVTTGKLVAGSTTVTGLQSFSSSLPTVAAATSVTIPGYLFLLTGNNGGSPALKNFVLPVGADASRAYAFEFILTTGTANWDNTGNVVLNTGSSFTSATLYRVIYEPGSQRFYVK